MAVKTASKRKNKSFDVGTQDKVLDEVLSAGKKNFAYTEGSIIPYDDYLVKDEPLIIEEPVDRSALEGVASYKEVHDRSVRYAMEHEDPQTRLEHKKKTRRLTRRKLFETVISIEKPNRTLLFPSDDENLDGLNFLAGKRVDEVNKMAELGTRLAHVDGGVPNIRISVPCLNEYYIGQLIYFFEIACGISGNVLGVNPFNQPGVEAYKKNMFALLDKPGYEADSKAIKERLAKEA